MGGSGFVTAEFRQFPSGLFELTSISYEVTTIPEPGTYVLRSIADDGALTGYDEVTVVVGR